MSRDKKQTIADFDFEGFSAKESTMDVDLFKSYNAAMERDLANIASAARFFMDHNIKEYKVDNMTIRRSNISHFFTAYRDRLRVGLQIMKSTRTSKKTRNVAAGERAKPAVTLGVLSDNFRDMFYSSNIGNTLVELLVHIGESVSKAGKVTVTYSPQRFIEMANSNLKNQVDMEELTQLAFRRHPEAATIKNRSLPGGDDNNFEVNEQGQVLATDEGIVRIVELRNAYVEAYNGNLERGQEKLPKVSAKEIAPNCILQLIRKDYRGINTDYVFNSPVSFANEIEDFSHPTESFTDMIPVNKGSQARAAINSAQSITSYGSLLNAANGGNGTNTYRNSALLDPFISGTDEYPHGRNSRFYVNGNDVTPTVKSVPNDSSITAQSRKLIMERLNNIDMSILNSSLRAHMDKREDGDESPMIYITRKQAGSDDHGWGPKFLVTISHKFLIPRFMFSEETLAELKNEERRESTARFNTFVSTLAACYNSFIKTNSPPVRKPSKPSKKRDPKSPPRLEKIEGTVGGEEAQSPKPRKNKKKADASPKAEKETKTKAKKTTKGKKTTKKAAASPKAEKQTKTKKTTKPKKEVQVEEEEEPKPKARKVKADSPSTSRSTSPAKTTKASSPSKSSPKSSPKKSPTRSTKRDSDEEKIKN